MSPSTDNKSSKRPLQENESAPAAEGSPKTRGLVWAALSLIALIWLSYSIRHDSTPPAVTFEAGPSPVRPAALAETARGKSGSAAPTITSTTTLLVHVAGRVRKPGVYRLSAGARVQDAVKKAGGPLPDADANQLNLAAYAEDGTRIEVPRRAGIAAIPALTEPVPSTATKFLPHETRRSRVSPATPKAPLKPTRVLSATKTTRNLAAPVNINRASADELQTLPGIGPAIAQRIIDYRTENGAFRSIENLDDVKGIGEKKLEKLKPYVLVY
jgi:competence protein ComEA